MAALVNRRFDLGVVVPTEEIIAHTCLEEDPFERLYQSLGWIFLRSTTIPFVSELAQGCLIHAFSELKQQYEMHPEQEAPFVFDWTYKADYLQEVENVQKTALVINSIVAGLMPAMRDITKLENYFLRFTENTRAFTVPAENDQEEVRLHFEIAKIRNP